MCIYRWTPQKENTASHTSSYRATWYIRTLSCDLNCLTMTQGHNKRQRKLYSKARVSKEDLPRIQRHVNCLHCECIKKTTRGCVFCLDRRANILSLHPTSHHCFARRVEKGRDIGRNGLYGSHYEAKETFSKFLEIITTLGLPLQNICCRRRVETWVWRSYHA